MATTYTQLLYHIVFSTKQRAPFLTPDLRERLFPYIGGIIREEGGSLKAIGGIEDHLHMLIRFRTDAALADLIRQVKSRSTTWLKQTFTTMKSFSWQAGYSAFTVSQSGEDKVRKYIENQVEHHLVRDFVDELRILLAKHGLMFREGDLEERSAPSGRG